MSHTVAPQNDRPMLAWMQQSGTNEAPEGKLRAGAPPSGTVPVIAEEVMASDVWVLEQAWLKAETIVDRTRCEAMRASERLVDTREKAAHGANKEIVVLLTKVETTVETLRARHEAAERQANDLFDRLLEAKAQGGAHV
jgi:hypothetical protein